MEWRAQSPQSYELIKNYKELIKSAILDSGMAIYCNPIC